MCGVCHCHVGEGGIILCRGLFQVFKGRGHLHGVVCYTCADVPPLEGCLLLFVQVCLGLYETCLKFSPDLFRIRLVLPDLAVFLKMDCLCNKAIFYAHEVSFCDGITCRGSVVYALVEPCIEALNRLVRVESFPQIHVICREVYGRYPGVVTMEIYYQEERCCDGVARKCVI